jgi:hypothetical protein
LRVINRIHTKLELRLIWFPTLRADKNIDVLGFDDEGFKLFQFKAKVTPIALRDGIFTRCKLIGH